MNKMAKIGLFFTLTIFLTIFYTIKTADTIGSKDTYKLYGRIDDASGLLTNSNIMVAGVPVGKLLSIKLEKGKALVELEILNSVKLQKNSVLIKKMQSMLGTSVLHILPGNSKTFLKNGDFFQDVQSETAMDSVMNNAKSVSEQTNKIILKVAKMFEKNGTEEKMNKILDLFTKNAEFSSKLLAKNLLYIRITLKNIAELSQKVNKRSESEMDKFDKLVESTIKLTQKMTNLVGNNDKEISKSLVAVRQSLESIHNQIEKSQTTIKNLENISGNVAKITKTIKDGKGNVGKILKDDKLYTNINNIVDKLSKYADSTIGMNVDVDFHTEMRPKNMTFKTYANVTLMPKQNKFYSIGIVDDPNGNTTSKTTIHNVIFDDGTGAKTYKINDLESKNEDKIKLSLQIGRIFGPIALRGGLIENKGGGGIDFSYKFFSVSSELFDFSEGNSPYLRIYGQAYPLKWTKIEPFSWIYLNTGIDNILRKNERNFFIGLGLRFKDNDIKSLLGSVPIKQ